MSGEIIAAWIAASVAILGTAATAILQIVFWRLDQKEKRKQEIMEHRKEALLSALQVIDHVFANSRFNDKPAANPHTWDMTLARDAMNKMIVYCKDPNRTVKAFSKAIGVSGGFGPADLETFRQIVCEELELPRSNYESKETLWIVKLAGSN